MAPDRPVLPEEHLLTPRYHIHKLDTHKHEGKGQALIVDWTGKTAKPCQDTKKHHQKPCLSCILLPVSSPATRVHWKEAGGVWGWDPTTSCLVHCAGTPLICCHCHHPSTQRSWPWESFSYCSVATISIDSRKGERRTAQGVVAPPLSCTLRVGFVPVQQTCHTDTGTHSSPGPSVSMTTSLSCRQAGYEQTSGLERS